MIECAMEAYPEVPRHLWVMNWPGQTVLAVSSTYWTSEVHQAISLHPTGLKEYLNTCNSQIEKVVELVRGKLAIQTRITLGMSSVVIFDFCRGSKYFLNEDSK